LRIVLPNHRIKFTYPLTLLTFNKLNRFMRSLREVVFFWFHHNTLIQYIFIYLLPRYAMLTRCMP